MSRNYKQDNPIPVHPLTAQRRLLLELLQKADRHINAKELYRLASARDEFISPATVYRSLKLFKQLGLVDERRLGKLHCYYEIRQSSEHQHLICQGCGKVIEFQTPFFTKLVKAVQREYGFNVTKAELYLEGCCPECEEKENTQSS